MIRKYSALLACIGLAGLFLLLGVGFIPLAGAQYDEALFVLAIFSPASADYNVTLGQTKVPIMLMSYLGTLKAGIMAPVFDLIGYNHRSLRFPTLAFGAISVALYFLTLRRIVSNRIAVLSALLLATDAAYLLTSVFDWGPVALQHLFFAIILYSAVRYSESRSPLWLILCGLSVGLALWDKAISIWIVAGGGLALLLVFPSEVWSLLKRPKLAAALVLPALLGASPLIYYNVERPLATIRSNIVTKDHPLMNKIASLDRAMNGGGLFGYIVRDAPEGQAGQFRLHERASLWLSARLGAPIHSLQQILMVGSILALPFMLWSPWRRIALFTGFAFIFSWALMLLTKGAGGSLHHTILLWPLPHLLAALTFAEVARRLPVRGFRIGAAVFLAATLTNLFVLNQYYAQFFAFGPTSTWTNAARPLVDTLGRMPGRIVFPSDWGIQQQVDFYGAGKLGVTRNSEDTVLRISDPTARKFLEWALSVPEHVFVTHTGNNEAFVGIRAKLLDFAASQGYAHSLIGVINDRHNVPIFELHEFRK